MFISGQITLGTRHEQVNNLLSRIQAQVMRVRNLTRLLYYSKPRSSADLQGTEPRTNGIADSSADSFPRRGLDDARETVRRCPACNWTTRRSELA